eukprot:TRINITY_DN6713_c2_g1_i1.p1 TRINITY_DN6713_c2_g1~~TRINITY_DN6713_c2_g1_i1.p1  ORF type:complete len:124 (+),score=17.72 TRINITY_DN6713_c2_g1_i1:120-491(+)
MPAGESFSLHAGGWLSQRSTYCRSLQQKDNNTTTLRNRDNNSTTNVEDKSCSYTGLSTGKSYWNLNWNLTPELEPKMMVQQGTSKPYQSLDLALDDGKCREEGACPKPPSKIESSYRLAVIQL